MTEQGDNPMVFSARAEAQQYAAELMSEFGPEANVALIELDELGLPIVLSESENKDVAGIANQEDIIAFKRLQDQINDAPTAFEVRFELIRKAVTGSRSLEFKRELAIGLLSTLILDRQIKALSSLPAQILIARLRCLLRVPGRDKQSSMDQIPKPRRQVYDDDPDSFTFYKTEEDDLMVDYYSLD